MKPFKMTRKHSGLPMTKGGYCDGCGHYVTALADVQVSRQTHSEPAEYELWCLDCCGNPEQDEERASLRGLSDEDLERI